MAAVWLWTGGRSHRLLLFSFQCLVVMALAAVLSEGTGLFWLFDTRGKVSVNKCLNSHNVAGLAC